MGIFLCNWGALLEFLELQVFGKTGTGRIGVDNLKSELKFFQIISLRVASLNPGLTEFRSFFC